jgi:hypothetical protein
MRKVSELRIGADATPPTAEVPWASALNATVECDEISVTLLALDIVDDLLRLTGVIRVGDRPDIRVASIPSLEIVFPDGMPLPMVDAHLMPHGRLAWTSWTYERPAVVPERLEATISHIVFEYRGTRTARLDVEGPWSFSLVVRPPALLAVADRVEGNVGRN